VFILFFNSSTRFNFPSHFKLAGVSIVPFFDAFGAPIPTPYIELTSSVIDSIELYNSCT